MADVFISYSRKDREFAARLHEALAARGKDVWIDWEDIPPSAKWRAEIETHIESADAFVFVISPDSLASEVCSWELDRATERNKRLIPVVCRDPIAPTAGNPLADLNWIFFRLDSEFDSGLAKLMGAIDTDLEWVRAHRRLLVRAGEWERESRDASFLLRGRDLEEAMVWRLGEAGKKPAPTELHSQYILASQEHQREEEEKWKALYERAERQRKRALSRQLALQSISLTEKRLDLAILVSVLARRMDDTSEARSALLNAITYSPFLSGILRGRHERVPAAALSPDGRIIAHTTPAREVMFWETATKQPRAVVALEHRPLALAFAPDSRSLAVGTDAGVVLRLEAETSRQAPVTIASEADPVTAVCFDAAGRRLAVGSSRGGVALWDLEPAASRRALASSHEKAVTGLAFDADGVRLASASVDRQCFLWDLSGPEGSAKRLTPSNFSVGTECPTRVAIAPSSGVVATGLYDSLLLWDAAAQKDANDGDRNRWPKMITAVAVSPNGETLVFGDEKGTVGLWDLTTRERFPRTLDLHNTSVTDVAFHPNGHEIMSAAEDGAVALWDLQPESPCVSAMSGHHHLVYSLAFSPDGSRLVSGSKVAVIVHDPTSREPIGEPILEMGNSTATVVAMAPAGDAFAASHSDVAIAIYDLESHEQLAELSWTEGDGDAPQLVHREKITAIAFEGTGEALMSCSLDGTLAVWRAGDAGLTPSTLRGFPKLYALAAHPTAEVVAVGGADGSIRVLDSSTLHLLGEPLAMDGTVFSLAFSPDGALLASGSKNGIVRLWDWRQSKGFGEPIVAHGDKVYAVAFHPDGKTIAVGGPEGAVLLFDVETQQRLVKSLQAHSQAVYSIAFSRDGIMASGSADASVILWDMNAESWERRARRIANRNFTSDEWRRYMGDEPYQSLWEDFPSPE